ncbi:MAG: hypothetical protein H0X27_10455 [Caulobacteraceae bacterium]|nr:hypothetical protein [Caulobacteraceae bacterium]
MIIFELPAHSAGRGLRASSLGSCRVRNPIITLRDRGDLSLLAEGPAPTHTAAEALQTLEIVLGEREIPDALSPLIFETEQTPSLDRLERALRQGLDVFVLEVSQDKQFSYGDIYLNQNFVARNLVQAQRGALLDWYRRVCRGGFADEACVQAALTKMREAGLRHDEAMADLLRRIRLDRHSADAMTRSLGALMSKAGGRWVVIGPFVVPGHDGAIMHERRDLNGKLEVAAADCGATFFDPSQLIADYGQATVLASDGADIYEYAEGFYPLLGEMLARLVRDPRPAGTRTSAELLPYEPRRGPQAARTRQAGGGGQKGVWRRVAKYFSRRIAMIGRTVRSLRAKG